MQIVCMLSARSPIFVFSGRRFFAVCSALLCAGISAVLLLAVGVSYGAWYAHVTWQHYRYEHLYSSQHLNALARTMGDIEARVSQMFSLSHYLVHAAHLEQQIPVQWLATPLSPAFFSLDDAQVERQLASLTHKISTNTALLQSIQIVLMNRHATNLLMPTFKPVRHAYLSSGFGPRINPFNGNIEFHQGCDFAAPMGTPITAAASGIVSYAGLRSGYGLLVEIRHAGYSTIYAHSSKVLVHVGEVVRKGQSVALVGSTGHSTGPHVHFEVRRFGVPQNPLIFLQLQQAAN